MEDLEKTYSLEQQRLGNGQELHIITTSLSLARSLTQGNSLYAFKRHCYLVVNYLSTAERKSQHTPPIRLDDDDVDAQIDPEEKDEGNEATTTATSSPAGSASKSNEPTPPRKIIRFDDSDPTQPNNWSRVGINSYPAWYEQMWIDIFSEAQVLCDIRRHNDRLDPPLLTLNVWARADVWQ
jgi:hypothetical protein